MDRRILRILTFNWREPYIHMLAQTGHSFDIVEPYPTACLTLIVKLGRA